MAYQQPARQAVQRPTREATEERDDDQVHTAIVAPHESQTWVLFSPTADTETTAGASSLLSSVSESQSTPGRSQLSEPGSVRSFQPSGYAPSYGQPATAQQHSLIPLPSLLTASSSNVGSEQDAEDDAELDSLDSHLADFRTLPTAQPRTLGTAHLTRQDPRDMLPSMRTTTTITTVNLPTHDGLGTFQLGGTVGMSAALQERLYAFEQFNPRRVTKRRRESFDLVPPPQAEEELPEEVQRMQRIEAWRLEHSRVLLDEIRKQTRQRRESELSSRRARAEEAATAPASVASLASASDVVLGDVNADWHDQEDEDQLILGAAADGAEQSEGLFSRLTRKFVVEMMGFDDEILSILFGEALPESAYQEASKSASSPAGASKTRTPDAVLAAFEALNKDKAQDDDTCSSWRLRMLERIAKELGQFVHRHINTHPGAFSTYQRVQQMPLPYAGLPMIPEAMTPPDREMALDTDHEAAVNRRRRSRLDEAGHPAATTDAATTAAAGAAAATTTTTTTPSLPRFQPTIFQAKPIDVLGPASARSVTASGLSANAAVAAAAAAVSSSSSLSQATAQQTFTQEEWEQDLDIKLVFRYLRSRFMSDTTPPSGSGSSSSIHPHHLHLAHTHSGSGMSISAQDAAAKAARVRQHHPLVGRNASRQTGGDRRPMPAYRNMNIAGGVPNSPVVGGLRHQPGSCASQSTRRSTRRSSMSSSRHYWDIGGSIGTGSMIAPAAPMGSWGEA